MFGYFIEDKRFQKVLCAILLSCSYATIIPDVHANDEQEEREKATALFRTRLASSHHRIDKALLTNIVRIAEDLTESHWEGLDFEVEEKNTKDFIRVHRATLDFFRSREDEPFLDPEQGFFDRPLPHNDYSIGVVTDALDLLEEKFLTPLKRRLLESMEV